MSIPKEVIDRAKRKYAFGAFFSSEGATGEKMYEPVMAVPSEDLEDVFSDALTDPAFLSLALEVAKEMGMLRAAHASRSDPDSCEVVYDDDYSEVAEDETFYTIELAGSDAHDRDKP